MTTAIIGISPFQTKDSRSRFISDKFGCLLQPIICGSDKILCSTKTACQLPQFPEIVKNVFEAVRREPNDFGLERKCVQRSRDFVTRRRTDLTERLGQNMRRSESFQKAFVHFIKAASAADPFAHSNINFSHGHFSQCEPIADNDWLAPS